MGIRSLVQLSFVAAALTLASSALADIPNPTTGTGGTTSSASASSAATTGGGGTSGNDPNCTVAQESIAGTNCMECDPTTTCGSLDSNTFHLACQASAHSAVYCDGPVRDQYSDGNVACAVTLPGGAAGGLAAVGAIMAAAAWMVRRRR